MEIKPRSRRPLPERPVLIQSGDLCLEGLLIRRKGDFPPALLSSPHPKFGGSMDAPLLNEIAYALSMQEQTSLRFNYRGVGASQGEYSGGEGELKDLAASAEFLLETVYEEKDGVYVLGGYSFGSCLGFELAKKNSRIKRLLMLGPPLKGHDFSTFPEIKSQVGILVGEKDTFCPVADLEKLLAGIEKKNPGWERPQVHVVPKASHYFVRGLSEAGVASAAFLLTGKFPNLEEEQS